MPLRSARDLLAWHAELGFARAGVGAMRRGDYLLTLTGEPWASRRETSRS